MSLLNNLLSSIDPTAAPKPLSSLSTRPNQPANTTKPSPRPVNAVNGASQAQPLKRKAEGQPDNEQSKIQRKDGPRTISRPGTPGQVARLGGLNRPPSTSDALKSKPTTPAPSIPYRGTAASGGLAATKSSSVLSKKPVTANPASSTIARAQTIPAKSAALPSPGAPAQPAKKGYAAMLQKAKERQQIKPPTPQIKHEPTKILTKKEREALRAQAKGKKPLSNVQAPTKNNDAKTKILEKTKPTGYQGTARPIKKPAESGYKGTARPSSVTPGNAGKSGGPSATRAKSQQPRRRDDGYANWSDLDDMDDDEEGYGSEDLSDMEGGIWDVEQEEQLALKAARMEDAEALAEENEHRRQKEERKRKLMSLAASAKKRY